MLELRDPISSASHLLTAVWAAYATLLLVKLTPGDRGRRLAVVVYGVSMILLYLASGVFHAVPYTRTANPSEFRFFQLLDQSAILVIIAGTNTPCMYVLLDRRRRGRYLRMIWLCAVVGIACLWLLPKPPHAVIVGICLGMGWLGLAPVVSYYRVVGWRAMNWMWLGAAAYTSGAVCELLEWPVLSTSPVRFGYHEIFHLCDIAGTLAFFLFITRHVIPFERAIDPACEVDGKPELVTA